MIIITFLLRESTFPCGNRISYVMDGYCFLPFISILNTRDKGKEGSSTHPSHAVSASKSGSPVHIGLIIIVFPRLSRSKGKRTMIISPIWTGLVKGGQYLMVSCYPLRSRWITQDTMRLPNRPMFNTKRSLS